MSDFVPSPRYLDAMASANNHWTLFLDLLDGAVHLAMQRGWTEPQARALVVMMWSDNAKKEPPRRWEAPPPPPPGTNPYHP